MPLPCPAPRSALAGFVRGLAALAALAALPTPATAGPWTRDAGGVYAKLSEGFFLADEYIDPTGLAADDVAYLGATTALYAEIGLADGLQLALYLPHVVARNTYDTTGDRYLSLGGGDGRLGVQYSPRLTSFPAALRVDAKIPMYDVAEPGGPEHALFPARGDGQLDVDLWLSLGGSLDALPLYGFVEIGHRLRTAIYPGDGGSLDYADGLITYAQAGYTLWRGIVLAANAQAVVPYADDGRTKGYATIGPSVYAPITAGWAVELYFDATVWARAASRGQTAIVGVSYSR